MYTILKNNDRSMLKIKIHFRINRYKFIILKLEFYCKKFSFKNMAVVILKLSDMVLSSAYLLLDFGLLNLMTLTDFT